MTTLATRPFPPRTQPHGPNGLADEQHLLLFGVDWESYLAIRSALADRPALRLTYDRGSLEFMTISRQHEFYKKWLARMIEIIAEELNRPIAPGGNMTFQHSELQRGLEGDECFWIEHEAHMRRKLTWEPEVDPPPDLFLEIEVSQTVLDRLAILAAFKVPEIWAFNGLAIRVLCLQADGSCQVQLLSRFFREIPVQELVQFLDPSATTDYLTAMRAFRVWLQELLKENADKRK